MYVKYGEYFMFAIHGDRYKVFVFVACHHDYDKFMPFWISC